MKLTMKGQGVWCSTLMLGLLLLAVGPVSETKAASVTVDFWGQFDWSFDPSIPNESLPLDFSGTFTFDPSAEPVGGSYADQGTLNLWFGDDHLIANNLSLDPYEDLFSVWGTTTDGPLVDLGFFFSSDLPENGSTWSLPTAYDFTFLFDGGYISLQSDPQQELGIYGSIAAVEASISVAPTPGAAMAGLMLMGVLGTNRLLGRRRAA